MINNLKEFKTSTKRIQKILQTFEIKTPEAFRLSNSASLNFMARILGYENYNTIKVVLENNITKGNNMQLITLAKNKCTINTNSIEKLLINETNTIQFHLKDEILNIHRFEQKEYAENALEEIIIFLTSDEKNLDLEKLICKHNDSTVYEFNPNTKK